MAPTILVVDDDQHVATLLSDILTEEGYAVRIAFDGCDALDHVEREPPTLIVTDIMMPRCDGVTLVRRLRDRGYKTPVVFLSAVRTSVDIPDVGFIAKPFNIQDVVSVVNHHLDQEAC